MSFLDNSYFTDPSKAHDLIVEDYLSSDQLVTAASLNPAYRTKLGSDWQGLKISAHGDHPESVEFADDVRAWQLSNTGFEPDGVLGPKTNAAILGQAFHAPEGKDYFLIDNVYLTSEGLRVVTPGEAGALVFGKEHTYASGLTRPDLFVVHWDGCYSSHQCWEVLIARGLSVPFMIDRDGTCFQGINPGYQTAWHAGSVNRRSWGVEIANPVLVERNKRCKPERPVIKMRVRDDQHAILGFYKVQLEALALLIDWSCIYAKIPRQLPCFKGQLGTLPPEHEPWQRVAKSYLKGPGAKWNVNGFQGICGHYHQDDNKCDPGMEDVWTYLIQRLDLKVVEVG